jgi:uncharacterized protein YecE (DUF72 family)
MAQLFAGTSGFAYPNWKPRFYPADVPQTRFLAHYATRLTAVEINYTFRRMPAAATLAKWVEATPPGFRFALKAHERITHQHRLKDAADPTARFLDALSPLREAGRLGPVLFQLPPQCRCDLELLRAYLPLLPRGLRFAFEFRHASWLTEPVYGLLRDRNISLCLAESETLEVPEIVTADFVYLRLRKSEYSPADLDAIRERAGELVAGGKDVFIFFKHEDEPDGALYAEHVLGQSLAG